MLERITGSGDSNSTSVTSPIYFSFFVPTGDGWEQAEGVATGCVLLGDAYNSGDEVEQNKSLAKKFYGKACDVEFDEGCLKYKMLNEQGIK
jgi:TPR repeat protein